MDFVLNPEPAERILDIPYRYHLEAAKKLVELGVDVVWMGDDMAGQKALVISPEMWRTYFKPRMVHFFAELKRINPEVKIAYHSDGFIKPIIPELIEIGRYGDRFRVFQIGFSLYERACLRGGLDHVMIHSCGDVDELVDDLIGIGLNCFNPFQPEVMDIHNLLDRYQGRLAFYGGLSTQQTLPYGSHEYVRRETRRLLEHGTGGDYIISPAHDVEGDVPLENMLAFIETAQEQVR